MLGAGFWWGKRKTNAIYKRSQDDSQLSGGYAHIDMPRTTQYAGPEPVYEVSGDTTKRHVELPITETSRDYGQVFKGPYHDPVA